MSAAASTGLKDSRASGKAPDEGPAEGEREGKLSWLVGWVVLPGLVALSIFLAGAYVGAHHPSSWITSFVRFFVD